MKSLPFIKKIEKESKTRYNAETEASIKNIRLGRNITKSKNHADLMQKLNS